MCCGSAYRVEQLFLRRMCELSQIDDVETQGSTQNMLTRERRDSGLGSMKIRMQRLLNRRSEWLWRFNVHRTLWAILVMGWIDAQPGSHPICIAIQSTKYYSS